MTSQPDSESWKSTERRFELGAFAAVTILINTFLLRDASAFVNNHGVIEWIGFDT